MGRKDHYVGPFDKIGGAVFGISLARALSAAYLKSGSDLCRLHRADGAEAGFSPDVKGLLPVNQALRWGAGAMFLKTAYDQGPNKIDLTQAMVAKQLSVAQNVESGLLSLGYRHDAYTGTDTLGSFSLPSKAATVVIVAKGKCELDCPTPGDGNLFLRSGASAHVNLSGSAYAEAGGGYENQISDAAYTVINVAIRLGKNSFRVNGVTLPENRADESPDMIDLGSIIHRIVNIGVRLPGSELQEVMIFDGYKSPSEQALLDQDVAAVFKIPL